MGAAEQHWRECSPGSSFLVRASPEGRLDAPQGRTPAVRRVNFPGTGSRSTILNVGNSVPDRRSREGVQNYQLAGMKNLSVIFLHKQRYVLCSHFAFASNKTFSPISDFPTDNRQLRVGGLSLSETRKGILQNYSTWIRMTWPPPWRPPMKMFRGSSPI